MNQDPAAQIQPLYRKEPKIYPRRVKGRFSRLRNLSMVVLLGIYYVLPWLRWDGRQAVLFDLPARKFYIFGITLFPQDFIYLALLLVIAGLSLFFFTALAGRLFCGFACPQTVWTKAFLMMERWAEGDRSSRMKLDSAAWTGRKIWRKTAKQAMWLSFALFTGITFVGYFTPILELLPQLASFSAGPWETFWTLFYGFATYGNAGYLRSQVCKYMCPYARFQSAMFDRDTLIISYDERRGEPRGGRSRKVSRMASGLGDCIDCTLCVQVCPTGIDIRDGLQYECIACALCIDICDRVMDRMGYERGLVKYTTERAQEEGSTRIFRPRVILYSLLLVAIIGGWLVSITSRVPLRVEMIRDRNALYRELSGGVIENVYTLRLVNMDHRAHEFELDISGVEKAIAHLTEPLLLPPEESGSFTISIRAPREAGQGGRDITLSVSALDDPGVQASTESRFFLPAGGKF